MKRKWLVTLASLSFLVGCGVVQPPVTPERPLVTQHMSGKQGKMAKVAETLGLSDTQRADFKAIVRKYFCDTNTTDHARKEAIKTLFLQPDFDAEAFAKAYQDMLSDRSERVGRRVAMLAEMRNQLTDEQRAKAIDMLTKKTAKAYHHDGHRHGRLMEKLTKRLNLTDEQKDAFQDLKDAMTEGRDARKANRAARHQAMASFIETGDTAALTDALLAIKPVVPVVAIANAMDSLTLDQRQKLVNMKEAKMAKWCGKDTLEEKSVVGETKVDVTKDMDDDDDNDDD